ncbi:MAG TPA: BadF/BadG/BcrA/BcrD ATPase family protein [Armatimonadota bacterium]|nr:BadF/BadG/BcrA/BcrD ATPase family protein [Armatimonadota bacterium]
MEAGRAPFGPSSAQASPRYVLGFDGGGSKAELVLLDDTGAVCGRGIGGPAVALYEAAEAVRASIAEAVAGALRRGAVPVEALVASAPAGIDEAIRALVEQTRPAQWRKVAEWDAILAASRLEYGLVVLAGTGSGVFARNREGTAVHMGGSGPVIGDEGSAYDIGVRGLRACVRADYSQARSTSLRAAVLAEVGVTAPHELIDWVYARPASRRDIAALARVVDREAQAGDAVACGILANAAAALADLALEALAVASMLDEPYAMVPAGSVATRSRGFRQALADRVYQAAPLIEPKPPGLSPAVGAGLLALRDLGVPWTDSLYARARETAAGFEEPPPNNL